MGSEEDGWLRNTREALRSLASRTKPTGGSVVLVLPAHLTLTKLIKIPRVEPVQRAKILHFEARENIPYALAEVVWGSVVVGETEAGLEVLLATAKLNVLDSLCAAAHEVGFEPKVVLPSSFATLAGFKLLQIGSPRRENFLGLNLGVRSTTLLVVEPGRFALRNFALSFGRAEGKAGQPPVSAVGLETVRTKLLQEITRSLLHFQWRSGIGKPCEVYLTGSGAALPGLAEAVREKFKVPVELFDPRNSIDFANEPVRQSVADHGLVVADLVGAAATQLLSDQPVVNLLPARVHQWASHRRRRPWLVAAALLAATGLFPPLFHFRQLREEAQGKVTQIDRELAPLRVRDTAIRETLRRLEEVNQRVVIIEDAGRRRESWLRLLTDLQGRLAQVEDVWLEKLQVAPVIIGQPIKLLVSGRMLDRARPLSKVSPENFGRVKTLLAGLVDSPFVVAIESERFDPQQPGILKFDFVLVADLQRPL